ncbi:hypothetical protein ACRRTK_024681 [Alexandromys fortis]
MKRPRGERWCGTREGAGHGRAHGEACGTTGPGAERGVAGKKGRATGPAAAAEPRRRRRAVGGRAWEAVGTWPPFHTREPRSRRCEGRGRGPDPSTREVRRGRGRGAGPRGRGRGGGAAGAGPIGPRGSGRGGAGAVPASPAGERVEAASLCGWLSRRRSRRRGAPRPRPAAPSRNELQESAGHSGPKAEAEKRETSKKVSPRGARARHRPAPPRRGLLAAAQAELPGPRAAGLPGRGAGSACPGGGGVGEGRAAAGSGAATWPGGLRAARAPRSIPRLAPLSHTRDPHLRPCPAAVGWGAGEGGGGALTAGLREPVRCRLCHLPVPPQPSS